MKSKLRLYGIYFHKEDLKDSGYYIEDKSGNLIKQAYKKPTHWEKIKYFSKYGYPLDTCTTIISYFYFIKKSFTKSNQVEYRVMHDVLQTDISNFMNLAKKNNLSGSFYDVIEEDNELSIKYGSMKLAFNFFNEGLNLKVEGTDIKRKREIPPIICTYLDTFYL